MLFNDRQDAGRQLATRLLAYQGSSDALVLGLARGGVAVAAEVAVLLRLPLNVVVVRKIGAPHNEELALGAITHTGEEVFNDPLIGLLSVSREYLRKEIEGEKKCAEERIQHYRKNCPAPVLTHKTVILVDDGIATGASIRAAIRALRKDGVKKIVLAVPVAASDSLNLLRKEVEEIICLSTPIFFESVGSFYQQFNPTSDEEIIHLLKQQKRAQ